jgi:hypothetical protein
LKKEILKLSENLEKSKRSFLKLKKDSKNVKRLLIRNLKGLRKKRQRFPR